MTTLTAAKVMTIFAACQYVIGSKRGEAVIISGVVHLYTFNSAQLRTYKAEIKQLLRQLPDEFMASIGGGWGFVNACVDKNGILWGQHINMEALFTLGIAVGYVKEMFDRSRWGELPGGMPYYIVMDE